MYQSTHPAVASSLAAGQSLTVLIGAPSGTPACDFRTGCLTVLPLRPQRAASVEPTIAAERVQIGRRQSLLRKPFVRFRGKL